MAEAAERLSFELASESSSPANLSRRRRRTGFPDGAREAALSADRLAAPPPPVPMPSGGHSQQQLRYWASSRQELHRAKLSNWARKQKRTPKQQQHPARPQVNKRPAIKPKRSGGGGARSRTKLITPIKLILAAIISTQLGQTPLVCCDNTIDLINNHGENVAEPARQAWPGALPVAGEQLHRLRVAAFASKLDHWFTCHKRSPVAPTGSGPESPGDSAGSGRAAPDSSGASDEPETNLNSPSPAEPAGAASGGSEGAALACAAHYDGHLCWPAARAGQTVLLPCPKLAWLLEEQILSPPPKQVAKSALINSMERQNEFEPHAETGKSIIKPDEGSTGRETEVTSPPERFAQRECVPLPAPPERHQRQPATSKDGKVDKRNIQSMGELENHKANAESSSPSIIFSVGTLALPLGQWASEANYSQCYQSELLLDNADDSAKAPTAPKATSFDPTDKWIKLDREPADRRLFASLVEELERIEGAIDPYADSDLFEQWSQCIGNIMRHQEVEEAAPEEAAHSAEQASAAAGNGKNLSQLRCPIIFDGWRCWPSTAAGQVAFVGCPKNLPGFSADREAHKICTSNGSWYRHPLTNRYWSNYTTCVDTNDLAFRKKILNLYVIGNLISLVALSASLIIFISFKSLKCTRVTIHKNLFLSFITNNLMWIIWYTCVVNDADLLQRNPIGCQLWHILLHYFLVSNYFWMFCEGLYLHTLLVVAFVSEDKILKWFYLLGWLIPLPITVTYAYKRSHDEDFTRFCWMEESPHNLILMAPIGISLLLNLIFLINIVRVLVTKLRANNSPDAHQTRKAVRATLILIPLLGLHYILTPFRPETKSEWEGMYEIMAAVCTSFQGLCVAMLFCFCNGEVMAIIKKKLKDTFNLSNQSRHFQAKQHLVEQQSKMRSRSNTTTTNCNYALNNAHYPQQHFNHSNHSPNLNCADSIKSALEAPRAPLATPTSVPRAQPGSGQPSPLNGAITGTASNNRDSNSGSLITTVTLSPIHSNSIKLNDSPHFPSSHQKSLTSTQTPTTSSPSKDLLQSENGGNRYKHQFAHTNRSCIINGHRDLEVSEETVKLLLLESQAVASSLKARRELFQSTGSCWQANTEVPSKQANNQTP